jgi:hypothetical protein
MRLPNVLLPGVVAALFVAPMVQDTPLPVWAKPDSFWFRKTVPGGHVWLTVDAVHGVKEPLFDHQRLAIELGVRGAGEFEPIGLPFVDPSAAFVVKYDGSNAYIQEGALAVEFNLNDQLWRCDLQIKWNWNLVPPTDYQCLPRRATTPADSRPATTPPPAASPDGRWLALVQDHNVAIRPAAGGDTRMLSSDGTAQAAYQQGSLQWSKDSSSLSAYRVHSDVWLSPSLSGNVKAQIQRGQWPIAK